MKKTPLEEWIIKRTGISPANSHALKTYQLEKLVETLSYAKDHSRFYQKQLAGIDPRQIKSWDQFERLPLTMAEDLKNNPFDFLCVPQSQIARIVTLNTSGTSGQKKRIFFTEADLRKTIDFFDYGMRS